MKLKALLIGLVAVAAALPVAGSANPVKRDRAAAVRACTPLRTSVGASTFGRIYSCFGACVSQFTQTARKARHAAQSSCRTSRCVSARVSVALNAQVSAIRNAAQACAAEESSMGADAFAAKYGTNVNGANAFGMCVSLHVSRKSLSVREYNANLSALNTSGVGGSVHLLLKGDQLTVVGNLNGLEPAKEHGVHVNGLASGNATCPAASADTNHDGVISYAEGAPFFGSALLDVTPNVLIGLNGHVAFVGHFSVDLSKLMPLESRTIVVQGKTVNGSYDATVPVACGQITRS